VYERHTGKSLKKREDTRNHWHCSFFKYCWDSGMSRLPTVGTYRQGYVLLVCPA
jgi:hypothetical protein